MSGNKIARKTFFLYIRMLVILPIAFYTSRVLVQKLGINDFGIYEVVGGVVAMFSSLRLAFSSSIQRFLNYEIGLNRLIESQKIFSMSIIIHFLICIVFLLLAEAIGHWFLFNKLVIDNCRMDAAMPAKMDEILSVANRYEIPVLEDAAEALGSEYKGIRCGILGELAALSFNGNKIITTSGGGALVSKNEEYIKKARFLATQARDAAPHYQHSQIGYNYRMSNIVAGIGRGQMEVLPQRVEKRRKNNQYYRKHLSNIEAITFQTEPSTDFFSNYWLTSIIIDPEKNNGITREDLRIELEKANIESRPLWKPMHLQPVFSSCPYYGEKVSESLFNNGLCLPSGSLLTEKDLERVVEVFKLKTKS